MVYRFIDKYKAEFGLRWLLRKFNLYPNAYYNYIKDRKSEYRKEKVKVQEANGKGKITLVYKSEEELLKFKTILDKIRQE